MFSFVYLVLGGQREEVVLILQTMNRCRQRKEGRKMDEGRRKKEGRRRAKEEGRMKEGRRKEEESHVH